MRSIWGEASSLVLRSCWSLTACRMWRISIITMRMRCKSEFVALHSHFFAKCEFTFPVVPTYSRGGYFDIENFLRPNLCRNLQNDISGINLAWKLHFENFWINSRICCCYLQFFIFCILHFLQIDAAITSNLQNKNFAFCVFQIRFLLGSFYYGAKYKLRLKARNLQFALCCITYASCNFLQNYQLASSQDEFFILHFLENAQFRKNWAQISKFCILQRSFAFWKP